jgi:hypothetical protein
MRKPIFYANDFPASVSGAATMPRQFSDLPLDQKDFAAVGAFPILNDRRRKRFAVNVEFINASFLPDGRRFA